MIYRRVKIVLLGKKIENLHSSNGQPSFCMFSIAQIIKLINIRNLTIFKWKSLYQILK